MNEKVMELLKGWEEIAESYSPSGGGFTFRSFAFSGEHDRLVKCINELREALGLEPKMFRYGSSSYSGRGV